MTREEIIAENKSFIAMLAKSYGLLVEEYLAKYPEMKKIPEWMFYPQTIDVSKEYKTKNGKRVVCLERKSRNDLGYLVTYPIKGCVVVRERPFKTEYCIWSEKGERSVGEKNGLDLDI